MRPPSGWVPRPRPSRLRNSSPPPTSTSCISARPNATHAPLARLALEHGKAVVCEKPLATSVEDARALVDAARASQTVTAVPFVYRFHPLVREVRARIAAGEAGRVWLVHGSYLQDWLSRQRRHQLARWTRSWAVLPGRSATSACIGAISWSSPPASGSCRLCARSGSAFADRSGTEDGAVILFETDAGATGSVVVSQVSPGRKNRLWFSFDGTDASYAFDQEQPDQMWVGRRDENRIVLRDPNNLSPAAGRLARLPAGHPQGYQDAFSAFVADVYAAVRGRSPTGCLPLRTACARPPSPRPS